ncbi:MAG: hypothetical protein IJH64_05305 [Oscillospiraceae bacterium]|nr:hypothetical protein [Oscillospiraceae bacterium]
MNYEDFKQAFKAEMMVRFGGPGMDIREHQISKVNQTMDALVFASDESRVAPQIYITDLFREYEQGKDLMSIVNEAAASLEASRMHAPEVPELSHAFLEENLYLTVMNPEMNRQYLSETPYEYLEDMAVVPRVRLTDEASFAVKDWMLGEYGFTREELFQAARANMENQEYQCFSLNSFVGDFTGTEIGPGPSDGIYVLTNTSSIDGAAAILSEKAMKQAHDAVGEDFFILPSSRHEVLLVPRSSPLSVRELTDMVVTANRTVVEDKDLLSDHVYRYNSSQGSIRMIEPKEESKKIDRPLQPGL